MSADILVPYEELTPEMVNRSRVMKARWKRERNGYASMRANGWHAIPVVYLALPQDHPMAFVPHVMKDEGNWPDVHGGVTFCRSNVIGWDYGHGWETGHENFNDDIETAIEHYERLR